MSKNIVSPAGIAEYPWLNKPNTKFNEDGDYQTNLILDPSNEAHQAFVDMLEEEYQGALLDIQKERKLKKIKEGTKPFSLVEEGKNEGMYRIRFRQKAIVRPRNGDPFEQKVRIFDAAKKLTDAKVGSGSKIKVAFEIVPYFNAAAGSGISLRLKAVQVLELVEYGDGDYGFEVEEGYTSDNGEADTSAEANTDF